MIPSLPFLSRPPTSSLLLMSRKMSVPLPPRPNKTCIDTAKIRNALNQNHFIDILSILTPHHQYKPDTSLPHYIPAGAYALRMQKLSSEFKRQVAFHLTSALPSTHLTSITPGPNEVSSTLAAISNRQPLIRGAVLFDQNLCISARIPFLIRADIAAQLFPQHIPEQQAPYIAVAIKRRPLQKNGYLLRGKCLPRAKTEYWLWNQLLAFTLNTDVTHSLVIGLKPHRTQPIALGRLFTSLENPELDPHTWDIATISMDMSDRYTTLALDALRWLIHVTDNGEKWLREASSDPNADHLISLARSTTDVRMCPNMKCAPMYDWPWVHAKKSIATQLCDLTLVSGISQKTVAKALMRGLPNDFSDERTTANSLEVDSHFTTLTLQKCKGSYQGPSVTPSIIPHNRFNWRALQNYQSNDFQKFDRNGPKLSRVEERSFYIDFELAAPEYLFSEFYSEAENEVDEEKLLPSRPAQEDVTAESLIFMIGCGQVINGEWRHEVFIADGISRIEESSVLRKWLEHMNRLRPTDFGNPILIAWGPEHQLLKKALRRMTREDAEAVKDIKHYQLVNMLQVVLSGCLSIRGAVKNSVKAVATALEELGVLGDFDGRPWGNGVQNGADAMALGLDAAEQARQKGLRTLSETPNMNLVASYNEADCRDIARIASYLREHH